MTSSHQICTNCAPIFFGYYQKSLDAQTELLHMREEVQRLSFTQQLGSLKDASDVEMSISPPAKYPINTKLFAKRATITTHSKKDTSRFEKHTPIITPKTIARSYTPAAKLKVILIPPSNNQSRRKPTDITTNVTNMFQHGISPISPIDRLKDFESQVTKKVNSFKKKLREDIARSNKRPSYSNILSAKARTDGKVLITMGDEENKNHPKVSMFSSSDDARDLRISPIEFKLTPKLERNQNTDNRTNISKSEWTVGTARGQRVDTLHSNSQKGATPDRLNLEISIKKIKESFRKDIEAVQLKSREASSPGPRDQGNQHSPFFSPLRCSELNSPNGHLIHGKHEELKKNYTLFIKPNSTPLLDSLMASTPGESATKSELLAPKPASIWGGNSSKNKKSSHRNNYYQELFSNPLEASSSSKFKVDSHNYFGSSRKSDIVRDNLRVINENKAEKPYQSNRFPQKLDKSDGDEFDDFQPSGVSYEKTKKKTQDLISSADAAHTIANHNDTWFIPVVIKDDKFYSLRDGSTEYKIGQMKIKPLAEDNTVFEGGILVANTVSNALSNNFFANPNTRSDIKAVLEVRVQGPFLKINKNTYLYTSVTPLKAIYNFRTQRPSESVAEVELEDVTKPAQERFSSLVII